MRSINKVILIGNLTRDPEMRQTPNGQSVTTFGMATNREWTTKSGDHNNSAEFHECVAWAHLAEICQKYLHKGNLIYIEGYLKTRSWDSPEGIKKFKTEIVVKDMIRLEKRPAGERSESKSEEDFVPEEEGSNNSRQSRHHSEVNTISVTPVAVETPVAAASSSYDAISEDLGL
ncbi:single-stranded DNA-binding protein [Candidatus Peregrinibacteria bacterium]|nr:single-stranded DNA-binding protein [Candidatus Peregrinibacteria bacterium]